MRLLNLLAVASYSRRLDQGSPFEAAPDMSGRIRNSNSNPGLDCDQLSGGDQFKLNQCQLQTTERTCRYQAKHCRSVDCTYGFKRNSRGVSHMFNLTISCIIRRNSWRAIFGGLFATYAIVIMTHYIVGQVPK